MADPAELLGGVVGGALVTGAVALTGYLFTRQNTKATNTTTYTVGELAAMTARLQTELQTLDAGQKMWQAMFESASERIDAQAAELVAGRQDQAAARQEHRQCREDLAAVQTEVRALRAAVERRRAPRD